MDGLRELSLSAKRDIGWWKIISVGSMRDPHYMSASISNLRLNVAVEKFLISDASTGTGGGAWLSPSNVYDESDTPDRQGFIRWTPEELDVFAEGIGGKRIDINVLEYFSVMYFVMLWGPLLRGQALGIKCDNTAAVSWLQKSRASNKSPVGETLVQTFTLFCIAFEITLIPSHVKGILNIRADYLSRDDLLQEPVTAVVGRGRHRGDRPEETMLDLKDTRWWLGQSREVICRQFLMASIVRPCSVPSRELLSLLKALQ
jgi:hypothetical protein